MKRGYSYQYTKTANMAKRANTRLRALEKANLTKTSAYGEVRRMGFDESNSIGYTRKGELKFRTDVSKMSEKELKEHMNIIENFLQSKTSKAGEIKKRRKQAFDKWKKEKERQGQVIDIDVDEFSEFWEQSAIKKLKDNLGSDEVELMVTEYGEKSVLEFMSELEKMGIDVSTLDLRSIQTKLEEFNENKKEG